MKCIENYCAQEQSVYQAEIYHTVCLKVCIAVNVWCRI